MIEDLLDDSGPDDNKSRPSLEETDDNNFSCSECWFVFTGLLGLNCHIEVHRSKVNVHVTNQEVMSTIINEEPIQKMSTVNTAQSVICPFCKLQSQNLEELKKHLENIHISSIEKHNNQKAPGRPALLAHAKQKVSNIVGLTALQLAFFMGYE